MTTYYKQINESGELTLLLTYDFTPKITNPLIIEITQEEYKTIMAEIAAKAKDDVTQFIEDEITGEEFVNMIEEVL